MYKVWSVDHQANQEDDLPFATLPEARKHVACLVLAARKTGLKVKRCGRLAYTMHSKKDYAGYVLLS